MRCRFASWRRLSSIAAVACAVFPSAPATPAARVALSPADRALVSEMNRARAIEGVPALRIDWALERAARAHSLALLASGRLTHGALVERLARFGVVGPLVGEDLGWGTGALGSPRAIVHAWLASPEHRRILLRAGFTRVGVAAVVGRFRGYDGAMVVTADFAGT